MTETYPAPWGKRIAPNTGYDGSIATKRSRLDEAATNASGGEWRSMGMSDGYGTNGWARGLADRLSDHGLRSEMGSNRFVNEGIFIRVLSLNGTTESDADLEFQPVWAQRIDRAFTGSNPFVRNTNSVSEQAVALVENQECPIVRVMTLPELNLLLSHETATNNLNAQGKRRTPAETLQHLGISFLGFVQNSTKYGQYRLMAIFSSGYALCGLPALIVTSPAGCKIWCEAAYTTQEDAIAKGMGQVFSTGSSGLQIPVPNTTPGTAMVADPVQVRIFVSSHRPFVPAGKGSVEYLGRVEKINLGGTESAPTHARIGMPKADNGRYQIVLNREGARRWG
ncbi:MAG: hypothetical protein AB7P49_00035 [Bdellovibrionales bacterium]